ncbi:MAG: acyl-CoA dehydrogenase family protein [Acidimicrobiia bacterium]
MDKDSDLAVTSFDVGDHGELRRRIRAFFEEDLPKAMQELESENPAADRIAQARSYRAALFQAGLAGLDYPSELGGGGGGADEMAIWREESKGIVPREDAVFGIGIGMVLPTLRDNSPELAKRFVPPGLRGDEIWCQLYSEPGAGSDLAALSTRTVRDGDTWVVNGQKVWTSGADNAQLAVLLARTDPDAPKHRGITMFILPIEQEGVEVRPLRQMTGIAEFNEVFITDARIPADWVVGEVNDGWRHAVALLAHERVQTGTASVGVNESERSKSGRVPLPFRQLVELAKERGMADDELVRQDLAALYTGEKVMGWLGRRQVHPSIGKLWRTRQGRAAAELAAKLAFPASPAWMPDDVDPDYWAFHFLNCRGMSLGGGTDEIQRNTLAEKYLELPRDPRP